MQVILIKIRAIAVLFGAVMLAACSSIQSVGRLGPKQLPVYAINQNDFLSSNHMLVVLDQHGDVKAYSGGTVSGAGTVAAEVAGTMATAGAIAYGARALESGMKNATVKGIPHAFHANLDITGKIADLKKN
jgi:hypothetical protein